MLGQREGLSVWLTICLWTKFNYVKEGLSWIHMIAWGKGAWEISCIQKGPNVWFSHTSGLLFLLFQPQNSTYITEISLPALCLLLLIAGLRKTHWKDRLQRKTAGTPSFFMFLHVEPTRNNPMYNRYRHVLPGLNSLHTPGIGCKAPFFLPGYPVHLYLHIDPEDSLQ